jgi:hypothetical protein
VAGAARDLGGFMITSHPVTAAAKSSSGHKDKLPSPHVDLWHGHGTHHEFSSSQASAGCRKQVLILPTL